jgi:hypothetical protein
MFLSALLTAGASFSAFDSALAAKAARGVHAADCEHEATMLQYIGQERTRFVRHCIATGGPSVGKTLARRPIVHPSGPTATGVPPLGKGNPPSTATGSTSPSTRPVAPSTSIVGSSGTSTSGSSATSITGSSGSTLGGSSGRSTPEAVLTAAVSVEAPAAGAASAIRAAEAAQGRGAARAEECSNPTLLRFPGAATTDLGPTRGYGRDPE